MLRGSCCCQAIKFTLSRQPTVMGTCHCTRCRKLGASILVFVDKDSFELVSGADAIVTYKPEAPYQYNRSFCMHCGTALGELTSSSESFPISANCFDDALGVANQVHAFVKEKPAWYDICDGAKQYQEHPDP
jgi:hypothetical protein